MKHSKLVLALVLGASLSAPVLAASPDWNYVQGGWNQMKDDELTQTGFTLGGSYEFNQRGFLRAEYSEGSDELYSGIDMSIDMLSLGAGFKDAINDTTDYYVGVSFERLGGELEGFGASESDHETGFGAQVGIRSMLTDRIEVNAEVGYLKISDYDLSEMTYKVGVMANISDQFAVGINYKRIDELNQTQLVARYSF